MSPFYYQNLSKIQIFTTLLRIVFHPLFISRPDYYKDFVRNIFKDLYHLDNCFLFHSNRSALYYLLNSLSLSSSDEVLVTAFTCSSVVEAIHRAGLTPVLVDISPSTFGSSLESIQEIASHNTKVVIVQHTFGIPADIIAIRKFCNTNKLFLIEDCALSLFSSNEYDLLGRFGDASIWSFELSKTISSGWGGLLSINKCSTSLLSRVNEFNKSLRSENILLAFNRILQACVVRLLIPDGCSKPLNYIVSLAYRFNLFRKSSEVLPDTKFVTHDLLWEPVARQLLLSNSIREICYRNTSLYLTALQGFISNDSFLNYINIDNFNLVRFPLLVQSPTDFISFFARFNLQVGEWFRLPSDNSNLLSRTFLANTKLPYSTFAYQHVVNLPLYCSESLAIRYQQALIAYLESKPNVLIDFTLG